MIIDCYKYNGGLNFHPRRRVANVPAPAPPQLAVPYVFSTAHTSDAESCLSYVASEVKLIGCESFLPQTLARLTETIGSHTCSVAEEVRQSGASSTQTPR